MGFAQTSQLYLTCVFSDSPTSHSAVVTSNNNNILDVVFPIKKE